MGLVEAIRVELEGAVPDVLGSIKVRRLRQSAVLAISQISEQGNFCFIDPFIRPEV